MYFVPYYQYQTAIKLNLILPLYFLSIQYFIYGARQTVFR